MTTQATIVTIILAGGAGRRLSGRDKGLELFHGKPLIEHSIGRLSEQSTSIIISANRNLAQYRSYGFDVVHDLEGGYQGPLAGITAALTAIENMQSIKEEITAIAICPCDTPLIPDNMQLELWRELVKNEDAMVAAVHDGERRHNLHCLIKPDARQSLLEFYRDGGRAIKEWQNHNNVIEVDFSVQSDLFKNLNSIAHFS